MRLLKNLRVRLAKNPISLRSSFLPSSSSTLLYNRSLSFLNSPNSGRSFHTSPSSNIKKKKKKKKFSPFLPRGSGVLSGKRESDFAASTVPSYCGGPTRKSLRDCRPIATQRCPKSDSPEATRSGTRKQRPAPGVCLYSYILSCTRDCSTGKI